MTYKYEQAITKARAWVEQNHPNATIYHKEAFINSVAYYVTGMSAGSGPSIREHLCSWTLAGDGDISTLNTNLGDLTVIYPDGRLPRAGKWELERAIAVCAPICFGQLSRLALKVVVQEHCFDDDPADLELISQWEIEELKKLSLKRKSGKLPQQEFNRLQYLKQKYR